ncbi:hypothetical protein [Chryseobacterium sp. M5A1_1a]
MKLKHTNENLIILLSFLSIFSCKKAQEKTSTQPTSNTTIIDKNWNGDVLISDSSFINTIDSSCQLNTTFFDRSEKQIEEDNLKCALSKVKFDYDKLNSINNRITVGKLSSEIVLFIKKSSSKITNDADLGYQATLYIEKNKTISDSIIIYQSLNYSEALTVKTKYYYLNMDNIYLLDVAEDESGASTEKWEHYKINTTGKISLVKQKLFSKDNSNVVDNDKNLWKGSYYFDLQGKGEREGNEYKIYLNISKDSVIYYAESYQLYHKFLLKAVENNNSLDLKYQESLDGTNSWALTKTHDFGKLYLKNGKYMWESPFLNISFTNNQKVTYILDNKSSR